QRTAGLVSVVGRQGIGPKASVVVVDVDGSRFVLGVTEQSVTVLHNTAQQAAVHPVAPAASDEFALALTDAHSHEAMEPPLAFRPRRGGHPAGRGNKLGGSILSPTTWQQTAAVLRQGR
ncbi:MAG TPA: flagellar biosynthetic protein FliO, partial [Glaciibacter sp.]|nr:flagellar biosynthetic protein FliO [Glaciibacter sp.]